MTTTIKCPITKPVLQVGSKGQSVREMQQILNQRLAEFDVIALSPLQIKVDGDFGILTQNAVKYLQCLAYLTVDGVVGVKTWTFLCDGTSSLPVLRVKSTGNIVKLVQQALKEGAYYTGTVDGVFGAITEKAVKEFQVNRSLVADGIIGRKTWDALIKLDVHSFSCHTSIYPGC
ncbi:peptidoglycan-binding domain-containing protein [Calothrix sp. 336/3]|uniref:peptidoglycan-binding domain-containing protein n=1 Tax=Calothrix sp. 336/3 TaxID=1337936 RepID=UPI0004E2FADA|nr:peptidoglycan-binding protein [Calothrix sp. 336/3]AKG21076.1 peptidoglycan-binding protein [Calothrix sp. 336/3]